MGISINYKSSTQTCTERVHAEDRKNTLFLKRLEEMYLQKCIGSKTSGCSQFAVMYDTFCVSHLVVDYLSIVKMCLFVSGFFGFFFYFGFFFS